MNKGKKLLICLSFVFLATGCTSGGKKGGGGGGGSKSKVDPNNWEKYEERYTNKTDCFGQPVDDYQLRTSIGSTLIFNIHRYMIDQHKTYLRYGQINANMFNKCDSLNNSGKKETFYTAKVNGGTSREHVWCCSRSSDLWYRDSMFKEHQMDDGGGAENYWGGGSDIYNLRPTTNSVNTARSSAKFYKFSEDELKQPDVKQVGDGGTYKITIDRESNPKYVEVADYFKGDTARIIMYMWIHYSSIGSYDAYYPKDSTKFSNRQPVYTLDEAVSLTATHTPIMCGTLQLTDIMGFETDEQCMAALKEWNELDPPSELEKQRNDVVESEIQGLRNPFVDYPQLVNRCLV